MIRANPLFKIEQSLGKIAYVRTRPVVANNLLVCLACGFCLLGVRGDAANVPSQTHLQHSYQSFTAEFYLEFYLRRPLAAWSFCGAFDT